MALEENNVIIVEAGTKRKLTEIQIDFQDYRKQFNEAKAVVDNLALFVQNTRARLTAIEARLTILENKK